MTEAWDKPPVFDAGGHGLVQAGIVVQDAIRTARGYTDLFGLGPWVFFDLLLDQMILDDRPLTGIETGVRIAMADLGRLQIELLEPMYGPSTYMSFLKERGEGVHHLSFGRIEDHGRFVEAMTRAGQGIEMQGVWGGAVTFTYLATQKDLGVILEAVSPAPEGVRSTLRPWGRLDAEKPGPVDTTGKEVVQVGLVVEDAEGMARRYRDLLGIGPWMFLEFKPPIASGGRLRGVALNPGEEACVRIALARHEGLEIELIQPVAGPGTHMDFIKSHGPGVHHLSFGESRDHDEFVAGLTGRGIEVEMTGRLGDAVTYTYLDTRNDLGTIFEIVKTDPGKRPKIAPYGMWPPSS